MGYVYVKISYRICSHKFSEHFVPVRSNILALVLSIGRDWWYGFLKRHPTLAMKLPESLQSARPSSCTSERLDKWYRDFSDFMQTHGLQNQPLRIWNAVESGFPLFPKSSQVLTMRNKKHAYSVNSDSKTQITTLVAADATGSVIPPMYICPGKRFHYNPLEGDFAGAYLGNSDNGWMVTELFYGWVVNHFVSQIPPERPVVLLVDGHTTHTDVEVFKICKENGIMLYCLLPHSSHITQPLDVGFFGALKSSWTQVVDQIKIAHMGSTVAKETFAEVFNTAWTGAVKMSTIVNSFERAAMYPIDRNAVGKSGPAALYSESSTSTTNSSSASSYESSSSKTVSSTSGASYSLEVVESMMNTSTITKFNQRFDEGYDVPGDEKYSVWEKLKKLSVSDGLSKNLDAPSKDASEPTTAPSKDMSGPTTAPSKGQSSLTTDPSDKKRNMQHPRNISKALADILVYLELLRKKGKAKDPMPAHLNSSQVIEYLDSKRQKKIDEKAKKSHKRAEREAKKAEKQELEWQKRIAREAKKAQAQENKQNKKKKPRTTQTNKATVRKKAPHIEADSFAESESSSTEEANDLETSPICSGKESDGDGDWVACDHCSEGYHIECTTIPESDYKTIGSLDWLCDTFSSLHTTLMFCVSYILVGC